MASTGQADNAQPLGRLPRGRHALSQAEVNASQRARLLHAMTFEVSERGFPAVTAAGVYQRAGVSSRAFYENFSNVVDCFLAAYDDGVRLVLESAQRRLYISQARGPLDHLSSVVDAYLDLVTSRPQIARIFLVEVYAAGDVAVQRRMQVHDRIVASLCEILVPHRRPSWAEHFAVETLVDALTFRITRAVISDRLDDPAVLRDEFLTIARRLCPWLDE